ncbi:geranylgeranylglycerol-phosphate geranylgeranyltransferase [Halorubellus sp. JP-L1]|uniref:geranylgeranylglycerol-phosphate geranylgeranyltransferase n=1 Tax=Halorubellus sp. JP-L1 TaxID=2715753 RepID=UPI00140BA195|nr:geranylgeranylglycerol-phosphate geranylgeranyltransferase [Halorubellus sp. JP-L1]NHN40041.1 geranylgeranylglycerol-phosphate geranylgeranyltransferase [Halorubellus sp. JP-L1]
MSSVGATVRGLVEMTRPSNSVAAGVLTFVGAFVAGGVGSAPVATAAAVAATVFATAAGMAINDYFDRDIDAVNRPTRPIPRGAVSARGALAWSGVLFAGAVACALALPVLALAIAVMNLLALVAYTEWFKGLPGVGNVVVAYLGGSTFLFGGAAVGAPLAPAVLFVLAALSTASREVIKDVEDVAGDREEGLNTLPIAIGERRALHVASAALVVAVIASPLPYVFGTFGLAYLVVVVPAVAVMLYAAYESYGDASAGQAHLKYAQFAAVVAFLAGRIVPVGSLALP